MNKHKKRLGKHLKKHKKHLPVIGWILVIILLGFFVANYQSIKAATYTWMQSSWSGGADTITTASHNTDQSTWTKYYSASSTISAGANIALSATEASTTETTDADFNAGATSTGYIYVASDTISPQKPDGYACTAAGECVSGECCGDGTCKITGGVCPCSASTTCGTSCSYSGLTYGTVTANSQCWLDRNLGATAVATAYNSPTTSYGDLYQWGRLTDGHQIRTSGTQTGLSSSDTPGHSNFIYGMASPYDWRSPQNNNLWQGVSGTNNPCPSGWRVPTQPEWSSVVSALGITNYTTAASSVLKLPAAGYRNYSDAALFDVGSNGAYWSSTVFGTTAYSLIFYSSGVYPASYYYRALGFSVRCLKN